MRLSDLLQTIQPVRITGNTSMEITGVNIDSRLIGTGHLFMAMRGTQTDGMPIFRLPSIKGLLQYCVKNCRKSLRPASPTFR